MSNPVKPLGRDLLAGIGREALLAELCRRRFAVYVERFWPVVTGRPLEMNRAIAAAIAVLQRVADGDLWRVLIAMPSGVGKSTLLALYGGWRLARNAGHRSIHMTHSFDLAGTESRRVRRLIESDEHKAMFPAVVLRTDESTVSAWATASDGRYYAVGRDSALLGRRAHEAVLDDPLDAGDRWSRAEKEALWQWFEESLMTRLDGDRAPVIVVHQRLCLDDLIGRLMEQRDQHGDPVWTLLELPAEFDDGTLLAPTILTREKLDDLKTRNPRVYRTMFLQKPDADDGAAIGRSVWRFHVPAGGNPLAPRPMGCVRPEDSPTVETPLSFDRIVISCDPTFGGTKTSNDNCSTQVWGADGPHRYLLARWHKKAKQREQREQIKVFRKAWPKATILIERAAGGEGMIEELEAEGLTGIEGVTVGTLTGGKAARLENVAPTAEQGFCYLLLGMHDLAGFVECLAGATTHDDDQDAFSQAVHWLNVNQTQGNTRQRWTALANGMAAVVTAMRSGVRSLTPEQHVAAAEQAARDAVDAAQDLETAAKLEPVLQAELDALSRSGAPREGRLEQLEDVTRWCRKVLVNQASRHEREQLRHYRENHDLRSQDSASTDPSPMPEAP